VEKLKNPQSFGCFLHMFFFKTFLSSPLACRVDTTPKGLIATHVTSVSDVPTLPVRQSTALENVKPDVLAHPRRKRSETRERYLSSLHWVDREHSLFVLQ